MILTPLLARGPYRPDLLIACFIGHNGVNAGHSNRRSALLTAPNGFLPQDIAEIGSSPREKRAGASRIRAFLEKIK
jgi:hypothetical protein